MLSAAISEVSAQGIGDLSAQGPAPIAKTQPLPIQVQVVVSRYRQDKKISSTPYSLSVKPGAPRGANLRLQTSVPVTQTAFTPTPTDANAKPAVVSYNYRDIGISMDVNVSQPLEDGRYEVTVIISESSLSTDTRPPGTANVPTLVRSYASQNVLALRDGQPSQYTAATDPVSGEVVRVDVTLNVPK